MDPVLEAAGLSMLGILATWAGVEWFKRLRLVLQNRRYYRNRAATAGSGEGQRAPECLEISPEPD